MVSSLESRCEISLTALRIKPHVDCVDEKAKDTCGELVDRSYQANGEMMAPQRYEAAKKDFEYLMGLLDLAIAYHHKDESKKGTH